MTGRTLTFRAVLEPHGPAAAVLLSDEQLAAVSDGRKTPPVRVTVNGHTFAGRIARRHGETMIGFSRATREACGVEPGEEIELTVAPDDAPREVEVPGDLATALAAAPGASERFESLSYTNRKEYVRWVTEAKRPETRERRVAETVGRVREGRTR